MDSIPGGSSQEDVYISRKELIDHYNECSSRKPEERMEFLFAKVAMSLRMKSVTEDMKKTLRRLIYEYKIKLSVSHRNITKCYNKNQEWFRTYIVFPITKNTPGSVGGRPQKPFEECSDKSKRRKTESLRMQNTPSELVFAAQMQYRAQGDIENSKILKNIAQYGSTSSKKESESHPSLSPEEALSLLVEAQLTKHQYNVIRDSAKRMNCALYPNYESITAAKKDCYPENVVCTESMAEVSLKNLLLHTTRRLIWSIKDVADTLDANSSNNLELICKWGCDGSGSHSQYKQKFSDPSMTDSYMFITSVVPIRLVCGNHIIWQNPRPSSARYCRPLRLQMAKETFELSKAELERVITEINALTPFEMSVGGKHYVVKQTLYMTMVDGKMVNAVTDTKSSMRCYLCGVTSKDFNRLRFCLQKPVNEDNLMFGISSLHAWIRFTECIIHVSYKIKTCKWQARTEQEKNTVENEKKRIQEEFSESMGLRIDKVRPGGGTSTDGNTARRFFENIPEVARITGFNKNLIERLHIILVVLSSGYDINTTKFKLFCRRTASDFVMNYPWYPMPTTLHKILIHGHKIIDASDVAIGLLSEDAQESRNKDVRRFRESFSRKFSREKTMEDTYLRLLVSSDPHITSLRNLKPKKVSMLNDRMKELLLEPNIY